ncbi:DEAD/DEAH box helicase family protein [Wolbachia endosymbiont (group E) of Neria commutata]|uniref:DEAD/DEAH box helicase family protein n=1 Tax=Wolbachia endosymbiont (group E) of Neria commutata TaxID=3066149 RepID=UPI0031331454
MAIFYLNQVSELIKKVIQQEDNSITQLLKKNIQLLKSTVEILNVIKKSNSNDVNDLVQEIQTKIKNGKVGESEPNGVRINITKQDDKYVIDFLEVKDGSAKTLKPLQGLKLTVQEKDEQYKWGASFGEGKQGFHIGGLNDKLPRPSQVSALEGLTKPLVLIATPTGSGKTITKLMFALTAWLSGLRVVSVDHRDDLVVQEYTDQQGAVLFNSTEHLASDNNKGYNENKAHNILSLDKFFAASNKIVNLDKLSQLIKENHAENEGFKVDLKNKKIIIGKNIEIDRDSYKVNGKVVHESIFDDEKLLVILDEIQEMVRQGQAYSVEIDLLLLLASWKKIKLVVATATPPKRVLDFIREEEREKGEEKEKNAYIEAKPLSQREDCGTIRITVQKKLNAEKFVEDYVKYHNGEILKRAKGEDYYYDPETDNKSDIKQRIREFVKHNLQSPRNRMTLVCSDCKNSEQLLKDKVLSPEKQLETLKSKKNSQGEKNPLFDKKFHNKCDFYQTANCENLGGSISSNLSENIKKKLINTFGDAKATIIDEVLKEFNLTSSIADSGVFAVAHGLIDDVIYCVTEMKLEDQEDQQLSKKRFSNLESLKSKFEDVFAKLEEGKITEAEIYEKIDKYISSKRGNEKSERNSQVLEGMKLIWNLFVKYKKDDNKLTVLLSNHNLSREIHKMIPPDFSGLSGENIFEIFAQGRSYNVFKYLKDNYDVPQTMGSECETLYREWKEADKDAKNYELDDLEKAKQKYDYASNQVVFMQLRNNKQKLQDLEKEKSRLSSEHNKCVTEHQNLERNADNKKKDLITKFKKEVVEALKDEKKYELCKLRSICNVDAIANPQDKFRVGWRFDKEKTSAFNDPWLYNAIIRQTEKDDLQQLQQGVGRSGRRSGADVSSSFVSSSKIGKSAKKVKKQLDDGDPFDVGATEESKIDTREFAKKVTEQIKDIISGYDDAGESEVASAVVKCVFDAHHELYNHSGYKNVEAFKTFIKTLENVTSTLKAECEEKDIKIGDGAITININGLDSKIDKITGELSELYEKLKPHKKERDKIKEKLKIDGNFLKRLIIELCTLVLRLWHWRLNPTQEKITEVSKKVDPLTLNDRMLLKKAAAQLAKETKPSEAEIKELEANKANLVNERTELQDAFNKIHETVGPIKREDGVTQKEITESEKNSIIKEQLGGIEEELNKLKKSLSESKKKHYKDLNAFETEGLKGEIDILEINIKELKSKLEEAVKLSDLDQALRNAQEKLRNDIKNIQLVSSVPDYTNREKIESLNHTIKEISVITEKYKDFFNEENISIIKEKVTTLLSSYKSTSYSLQRSEKDNIERGVKELSTALMEGAKHIKAMPREQEQDIKENLKKAQEKTLKNIEKCKNKTQIEVLYNLICEGIADFDIDKATYNDARELLSYINKLTEEKTRLEKIQKTQKGLAKEIDELNEAKRNLQDPAKQTNICNRLLVYKSIEKNYGLNRTIWTLAVFCYFLTNDKDKDDYISSTVFLELFTNIMMPLMNDGALKMAFEAMESSGNSSADKVEEINKLYQNLVDRKFDKIGKNDVSKVFGYMGEILLMIAPAKVNHHINGISKGLNLLNNINFGQTSNPSNNVTAKLQEHLSSLLQNHLGSLSQNHLGSLLQNHLGISNNDLSSMLINSLREGFEGKGLNLQSFNPLTQEIYTADVKSGIPMFTTMNLLKNALCFAAAELDTSKSNKFVRAVVKKVSDTSIKEAKKTIKKFGEGKDQDDILKDVYEFLMILLNKLQKPNSETIWSDDLTAREEFAQILQQLAVAAIAASQKKDCPASSFIDPSPDSLDPVQATAKDFIARPPNLDNSNTTKRPTAKGRPPVDSNLNFCRLESGNDWWQNLSIPIFSLG